MTRTLSYFIGGCTIGWLVLAGLCFARWQVAGLECCGVTGAICFVPTGLSLLLTLWSADKSGSNQLMAVFGGMALRMGAALGLGVSVFLAFPYFKQTENTYAYWGSLLLFYLFSLGLESFLAARYKPKEPVPATADGVRA